MILVVESESYEEEQMFSHRTRYYVRLVALWGLMLSPVASGCGGMDQQGSRPNGTGSGGNGCGMMLQGCGMMMMGCGQGCGGGSCDPNALMGALTPSPSPSP